MSSWGSIFSLKKDHHPSPVFLREHLSNDQRISLISFPWFFFSFLLFSLPYARFFSCLSRVFLLSFPRKRESIKCKKKYWIPDKYIRGWQFDALEWPIPSHPEGAYFATEGSHFYSYYLYCDFILINIYVSRSPLFIKVTIPTHDSCKCFSNNFFYCRSPLFIKVTIPTKRKRLGNGYL